MDLRHWLTPVNTVIWSFTSLTSPALNDINQTSGLADKLVANFEGTISRLDTSLYYILTCCLVVDCSSIVCCKVLLFGCINNAFILYSKLNVFLFSSDTFVVCMESITAAIDGPLAFIAFVAFMRGSNYRYAWQLLLSLFQLYGDVLYFMTEFKEGFIHSPTDIPLYFYFYFIFLNSLWIIIPLLLIVDACHHIASCQQVSDFYHDEYNRKAKFSTSNSHLKEH